MNKINLLVVEDDNNTVEEYKTDIKGFENFYLVGTTNNSSKAVEMVKRILSSCCYSRLGTTSGQWQRSFIFKRVV